MIITAYLVKSVSMVAVDQGAALKMIALLVKFASTVSANVPPDINLLEVVALM